MSETAGAGETTIVLAADDNYVGPLLVVLASVATNGGPVAAASRIAVLHPGLSDASTTRVRRVADALDLDVALVPVAEDLSRFPVTDWISSAAYLRLLLERAAREATHVLYLDCDLLVVDDLTDLIQAPTDHVLAAVRDVSNPLVASGGALPGFEDLGLPPDREYFNSGVMRVDVARWRDEAIADRCASFLVEEREHVRFWDQDALNVVLDDQWTRLPLECNVFPLSPFLPEVEAVYRGGDVLPLDEAIALEDHARILHFAGPAKPWRDHYPDHPMRARYREVDALVRGIEQGTPSDHVTTPERTRT